VLSGRGRTRRRSLPSMRSIALRLLPLPLPLPLRGVAVSSAERRRWRVQQLQQPMYVRPWSPVYATGAAASTGATKKTPTARPWPRR